MARIIESDQIIDQQKKHLANLNKELVDTKKAVEDLTGANLKLATSLDTVKKSNDGAEARKLTETTEKLAKSTTKLKEIQTAYIRVKEDTLKANVALAKSQQDHAVELEKVKIKTQNNVKANKELAKSALGLATDQEKADKKAAQSALKLTATKEKADKRAKESALKLVAAKEKADKKEADSRDRLAAKVEAADKKARASALKLAEAHTVLSKKTNEAQRNFKNLAAQHGVNSKEAQKAALQFDKLNNKLSAINKRAKDGRRDVGRYGLALKNIGSQLAGGLGITAAIGFLGSQLSKANKRAVELTKSTNRLKNTFGLTTSQSKKLAVQINAISNNFDDVDSKKLEVSLTAITGAFEDLSEQDALNLIEEGFQKGSDNSGEFLDILREYPSFFQKAGLSASQMFAIINQQVKAGVYSDKGVDSIKEATIQLTENTKIVKAALKPLGESVNLQIRQRVEAGKSFEAMQLITAEMEKLGKNSSVAQTIIADVFKGAGEDSENFLRNLHNVTLSLDDVAKQTSINEDANLRLSKSYNAFVLEVAEGSGIISEGFATVKDNVSDFLDELSKLSTGSFSTKMKVLANSTKGFLNILTLGLVNKFEDGIDKLTGATNSLTFSTDKSATALSLQKINTDKTEKSTRRLTTAEQDLLDQEKKRIDQITNSEEIKAKEKARLKASTKAINDKNKALEKSIRINNLLLKQQNDIAQASDKEDAESITEDQVDKEEDNFDAQAAINDDFRAIELEKEQEFQDGINDIKQQAIETGAQFASDFFAFKQDEKLAKLAADNAAEEELLKDKLDKGLISEEQFKQKIIELNNKQRTAEAKAEKKKALFDITVATAVAVAQQGFITPAALLAGIAGAIATIAILAKPIPKFEKGIVNINGPRHSQGGMLAEVEGGESYINRIGTSNAPEMLKTINSGLFKDGDELRPQKQMSNELLATLLMQGNKINDQMLTALSNMGYSYPENGMINLVKADGSETRKFKA